MCSKREAPAGYIDVVCSKGTTPAGYIDVMRSKNEAPAGYIDVMCSKKRKICVLWGGANAPPGRTRCGDVACPVGGCDVTFFKGFSKNSRNAPLVRTHYGDVACPIGGWDCTPP